MQRHHTQSEIHLGFFALIRRIITSSLPSSPVLTVELQKMKMEAHEDEMRSLCVTLKPPDLNLFPVRYLFYGLRFTHKLVICLFISILGFPVQSIFSYFSFHLHFSYPSLHFANLGLWFGKKMLSVSDSLTRIDGNYILYPNSSLFLFMNLSGSNIYYFDAKKTQNLVLVQ